jgi:hypothetical protein
MMALLRLPTERVRLATTANWLALFKCLLTGIMAKSALNDGSSAAAGGTPEKRPSPGDRLLARGIQMSADWSNGQI